MARRLGDGLLTGGLQVRVLPEESEKIPGNQAFLFVLLSERKVFRVLSGY